MTPDPPFRQVVAELLIRGSIGAFAHSFWDLQIQTGSRVPPGPCFLYGNHSNNFDPFLVNMFTDLGTASSGVMTMEYLESGPLAIVFGWLGLEGTRKRVPEPHLIRRIHRMLDSGRRVLIYPEGGRRWSGRPGSWIESTAKLFLRTGVPVYPVLTHASYVSWPRWARWPRPANVRIDVLPAVDLSDVSATEEAIERLSRPIDIDENTVPEELRPAWAFRPAEGIERLLYRDPVTGSFDALRSADGTSIMGPDGRIRWTMLPDSRLLDPETGRISTTAQVYDAISSLPIESDSDGVITRTQADVRRTERIPRTGRNAKSAGRDADDRDDLPFPSAPDSSGASGVDIRLRPDGIGIGSHHVSLSDIDYIGLERNDILWIQSGEHRCELHFNSGGSVLAFHDTMLRLSADINPDETRPDSGAREPLATPSESA